MKVTKVSWLREGVLATRSPSAATNVTNVTNRSRGGPLRGVIVTARLPEHERNLNTCNTKKALDENRQNDSNVGTRQLQQTRAGAGNRLVAVNAQGRPVGEDHPRAVLANAEIDLVFALRAETDPNTGRKYSLAWLAGKFEVSKTCIADILSGRRRAVIPSGYRRTKGKR